MCSYAAKKLVNIQYEKNKKILKSQNLFNILKFSKETSFIFPFNLFHFYISSYF